ncbi:MAG: MATE family efflux transporter, partial [Planctomycetota bacterium]
MTPQLPPSTKKKDLTTGSLAGNIFRLAGPMTVGMFLHSFYSMADAFWLGRLSKLALASQTVCWPFMFLAFAVGMGFGTAGTTLVSQYTGADRPEEAELAAGQTMLLLVALTASVALPVIALAPHLLWLVNAPENTVPDAILYLRIMMLGMPLVGFIVA